MEESKIREIAKGWYAGSPACGTGAYSENLLFRTIYDACVRLSGTGETFESISDYADACKKIRIWYLNRYETKFGMARGGRGQQRLVVQDSGDYGFDALYGDKRQFETYLLTDIPQSGNQDLCSFVMHMAVAFMISPAALDRILQQLGFHPLHVKNMHHLAIYTVLMTAGNFREGLPEDFNPLAETKRLYLRARALMETKDGAEGDTFDYADLMTKEIRRELFFRGILSARNFDRIVTMNKSALNTRHSLILRDYRILLAVYLDILADSPGDGEKYTLYQFVNRFCGNITEKKFRDGAGNRIENHSKHPTRQMVILLWLYDSFFRNVRGVPLSNEGFRKIQDRLRKIDPALAGVAKAFYYRLVFDVYGFVHGIRRRVVPEVYDGAEFVARMNMRLLREYEWGQLNPRLPFDYYIQRMKGIQITYQGEGNAAHAAVLECDGRKYLTGPYDAELAPHGLCVFWDLMDGVKDVIGEVRERKDEKFRKRTSEYPLPCNVYEQL